MSGIAVEIAALALGVVGCGIAAYAAHEARGARLAAVSSARAAGRAAFRAEDSAAGRRPDPRLDVPDPDPRGPTLQQLLDEEGLRMFEERDPVTGQQRVRVYRTDRGEDGGRLDEGWPQP